MTASEYIALQESSVRTLGEKAGTLARKRTSSQWQSDCLRRILNSGPADAKPTLRKIFDEAYREEYGDVPATPFR